MGLFGRLFGSKVFNANAERVKQNAACKPLRLNANAHEACVQAGVNGVKKHLAGKGGYRRNRSRRQSRRNRKTRSRRN